MNVEIKNRFSGEIILCGEYKSIKECLEKNRKANLFGANLSWANLSGANLSRADLPRADLSGANLSGADLYGAKLDKTPIQILGLLWPIMITKLYIKIGCEIHNADEWDSFKDSRIKLMGEKALDWWKCYKPIIMDLHKKHCEG